MICVSVCGVGFVYNMGSVSGVCLYVVWEGNWQTVASRKCGKFRKGPGLTVRGDAT